MSYSAFENLFTSIAEPGQKADINSVFPGYRLGGPEFYFCAPRFLMLEEKIRRSYSAFEVFPASESGLTNIFVKPRQFGYLNGIFICL